MQLDAAKAEAARPVTAANSFKVDSVSELVYLNVSSRRGYSFSYPRGYAIYFDNSSEPTYTITAGAPPLWEVITVTETGRLSDKDVSDVMGSFNKSEVLKFVKTGVNGRDAWLLNAYVDDGLGVLQRQGFVQCVDSQKKQYTLVVTGLIPRDLAPDAIIADDVIRSVGC